MKQKQNISWCMTVLVLFLLIGSAVINIPTISPAVERLLAGESDFAGFTRELRTSYTEGILGKAGLINVNGLFARLTGRRICNEVVKLDNGMLTWANHPNADVTALVQHTIAFCGEVESAGMEFLYVQAVQKPDQDNTLLPENVENYGNANAREVVAELTDAGVPVLDMAPYLNQTPDLVVQNYFRTDHHWSYQAAFHCFQLIAQKLQERMPEKQLDLWSTQLENWQQHSQKNAFVGSQARRVGKWYAGIDDLTWYTPLFDTKLMYAEPYDNHYGSGNFEEANLFHESIGTSLYSNSYELVGGTDRGLIIRHNQAAPNDLHIVLVKDSFANPMAAFMSVFCRRIDIIDPRLFCDSISRYISSVRPNVVIWLLNSNVLDTEAFYPPEGELAQKDERTGQTLASDKDIQLAEGETCVIAEVSGSKICRLSMENIQLKKEALPFLAVELQPRDENVPTIVQPLEIFQGQCEWTFAMPEDNGTYDVVLRAGLTEGHTVPVVFEGVVLEVYDRKN